MDHADPWPLATVSCPRLSSNAARSCVHGKFFSNYPSFCRVRGAFSESTPGVFRAVMRPARERGTSFIGSRVRCTPPSAAPFKRVQPHAGAGWIRALQGTVRLEVAVIAQAVVSQFFLDFSLPVNPALIPAPPQPQPHFFKSYFQGFFFLPFFGRIAHSRRPGGIPFHNSVFFFFLGATRKQTIVSFLAGLKFSRVFCRGSAPEQRRVVTFLSWEAKFQSHYKIFSESMFTSWFFFNLVQGFMECAVQSPGFALTVRQMSFFFFFKVPNLHGRMSPSMRQPAWLPFSDFNFHLFTFFKDSTHTFFTAAEENIQTVDIDLKFFLLRIAQCVVRIKAAFLSIFHFIASVGCFFALPHIYTCIYFTSFQSFMCDFACKQRKWFDVAASLHPPCFRCCACARAVASQCWQCTDEGLHCACLWLTWLRKTALGFAPRGREDCAIPVKITPVVPTSVTRKPAYEI